MNSNNDLLSTLLNISQDDLEKIKSNFDKALNKLLGFCNSIQNTLEKIEKIDFEASINNFYKKTASHLHKELIKHGLYIGLSNWSLAEISEIIELIKLNQHDKIVEY